MRGIACGDFHLTDQKPEGRLDESYMETCLHKLDFILKYATNNNISYIFQPGDFTNKYNESHGLAAAIIDMVYKYKYWLGKSPLAFHGVLGQHDTPFHVTKHQNTIHHVLRASGVVNLLGPNPTNIEGDLVYGASWGDALPKAKPGAFNILVTHRMVIDGKLWSAQENYEEAHVLLRETGFDLIISGDNHTSFDCSLGNKKLINCGSLLRSTVAQKDHRPCFWVFDTDLESYEKIYIPVASASQTLSFAEHEQEKKDDARFDEFIAGLKKSTDSGVDFKRNMRDRIERNDIPNGVVQKIEEAMGD